MGKTITEPKPEPVKIPMKGVSKTDPKEIVHDYKEKFFRCNCGASHLFRPNTIRITCTCGVNHNKVDEYLSVRAGQGVGVHHKKATKPIEPKQV